MSGAAFLKRVVIRNYKSISACSVPLGPMTFLVGPNGAGKSNFLDALRFVTEALNTSLEHALRDRGGIGEVRRRSLGHPTHFGIRLECAVSPNVAGHYAFLIRALEKGGFQVKNEECILSDLAVNKKWFYKIESGKILKSSMEQLPPPVNDRLYLVTASGVLEFRPLYDLLSHMGFYNFNPDEIRELQTPDPGIVLRRDGSNLASVLNLMEKENPSTKKRIVEFLSKVVPGVVDVEVRHVGKKETLEFRQKMGSNKLPWRFFSENMPDGTLRALGVLTALFQSSNGREKRVPLVGIEEPEVAVHPGAAGVIRDGIRAASKMLQVIVTSHSPDLLDDKSVSDDCILGVINEHGETKLGPLDEAGRSAIRDRLYTAGELLKLGQLQPDIDQIDKIPSSQLELFGE